MKPEFSRIIDIRSLGEAPVELVADDAERQALADRFGLVAINHLSASVTLESDNAAVNAAGRFEADIVQSCAVSGQDLPVIIAEALSLRFVPKGGERRPDEEVELAAGDLDEIDYSGTQFDLGEAIAQSLALAIDPFLESSGADEFRRSSGFFGDDTANPFAALAKLKKD